jgi:membrane-associated protease RseP (regulator of RpoE activity)
MASQLEAEEGTASMRSSIAFIALATAFALVSPADAGARPRRSAALAPRAPAPPTMPSPALAPVPPAPPGPPAPAFAPSPPSPPGPPMLALAPTAPLAPMPPLAALAGPPPVAAPWAHGGSFSFSFGKGRLGVQVTSMTPELRRFFGAPEDAGLLVQGVEIDTPASKAGVVVGDVIVVVDGDEVGGIEEVGEALSDRNSGATVELVVIRGKQRKHLRAELRDDAGASFPGGSFPGGSIQVFGDDSALRSELEALRERMEKLEQDLGQRPSKPRGRPKRSKPKPDPKKT